MMAVNATYHRSGRLPIWRDSQGLLLETENAVRSFSRYHKYTVGLELRRQAMRICQILSRALAAKDDQRLKQVEKLVAAVDDIKLTIQLAKELKAFANFRVFQQLAELAVAIGKQGGAWLRHLASRSARPVSHAH